MKTKIKYLTGRKGSVLFLLVLFFTVHLKAQTSQYNINDPRNPNCPCHKYQKIADEEYARLTKVGSKANGEFIGRAHSRDDKISKKRNDHYKKYKRKTKDKAFREPKWMYELKHWDIWKRMTDPIRCPVWNG